MVLCTVIVLPSADNDQVLVSTTFPDLSFTAKDPSFMYAKVAPSELPLMG